MDERGHKSLIVLAAVGFGALCQSLACGRIADEDDGGADAAPPHCSGGVFTSITPLSDLNTPADERGLRFTRDELHGVFTRVPDSEPANGFNDILSATRSAVGAPFVAAPLGITTAFASLYPSIVGGDLNTIFFESSCDDGSHVSSPFCLARYAEDGGYYDELIAGADLSLNSAGIGPFPLGARFGDGYVTSDGGAFYFAALFTDLDAGQAIFVDGVDHSASDPHPSFSGERVAVAPADATTVVDDPVPAADELTLFLSARAQASGPRHVSVARRSSTSESFGVPAPVPELDSAEGEYPTWLSSDACRLYFTRIINGQGDLYVASRSPD